MPNFEILHTPLNAGDIRDYADEAHKRGRIVSAIGVSALIADQANNFLVLQHSPNGVYGSNALGTHSETLRWVPYRDGQTETPFEAWIRSLGEELEVDNPEKFQKIGFHFDRREPVQIFEIPYAVDGDFARTLLSFNLIVRVDCPEALERTDRISEEIRSARFMPLHAFEASTLEKRPGYDKWFRAMYNWMSLPRPADGFRRDIHWGEDLPVSTGDDVRFPYK